MPDYSKTIIYKIQHEDNEELLYIGSTTEFTKRKSRHKSNSNNPNCNKSHYKLYKMINDNGGFSCFNMLQIKEFPCENRREAEAEEDKVMLELKANMNDKRASRSHQEYYNENKERILQQTKDYRDKNKDHILQQKKVYHDKNKDHILQQKKEYYNENKEQLLQQKKEYYNKNKEQLSQQMKEYYQKNKERLSQYKKEKITCDCGCIINKGDFLKHKRTQKHIKLLNETKEQ